MAPLLDKLSAVATLLRLPKVRLRKASPAVVLPGHRLFLQLAPLFLVVHVVR